MTIHPPTLTPAERERFYRALEAACRPATRPPPPDPEPLRAIPPRFDGAVAWSQLEPEVQAAIGAAALELAIARYGLDVSYDTREERVFEAAEAAAGSALMGCALGHMLDLGAIPSDQVSGIPSLLGPVCRQCGCSEHDACSIPPWGEACSWTEPDLCSGCAADGGVRPRTAPAPEDPT